MTSSDIDPPEDVPSEVNQALDDSTDRQLREIIHYTQRLIREHPSLTEEIEVREGEELVRIDDRGVYKSVIVERPDPTGEARGPFAYHVQWEPDIDGEGGHYHWHYFGRVITEQEDE